jgi:hypothetical protein
VLQIDTAAAAAALLAEEADHADALRALGLESLDRCTIELGAAGPHVSLQIAETFRSDERGAFGAFFPAAAGVPAIAALRPDGAGWKAGRFDLRAFVTTAIAVAASATGSDEATTRGAVEEHIGDLETGLLSHFTDECLLFGTGHGDGDEPFLTAGFAFRIQDAEAFVAKWNDARKELGMTELEEETVDGGFRVQRLGGWFQATSAIGPDVFALAYGPDARARIDELVAKAKKGEWTKSTGAPESFQPALRHQPPGLNGVAEADIAVLVLQASVAFSLLGELVGGLPDLDGLDEEGKMKLQALLAEHSLATARSLTGYADRRWCFRLLW